MLRLRTFGGLWIEGIRGVEAPAPPPRRLALLALLSSAGPRGVSRERLLGILWPDVAEERGRHALAQTVYSLRRDLGNDAAITGPAELRIDPAVLASDTGDLVAALESGDGESVARLYSGPFLDGFYLNDAAEFERWVEGERARFAASAILAIEQLAETHTNAGRHAEALPLWRRLTELDQLRGRFAAAYMRSLAQTGDRAGALAHARAHEIALRRELDTASEPEVRGLLEELRGDSMLPPVRRPPAQPEPVSPEPGALEQPGPRVPAPGRGSAGVVLAGVVVLLVSAFLLWRSTRTPAVREYPLLAVGSLRDAAARDSSGGGDVLTDMLATSLSRIQGLSVVANSRLLELIPRGTDTVPGTLPDAARRAGAREILEGELGFAPDGGLRLELRRIDLGSGVLRQVYTVRAFDRYAIVDSATAAIAAGFGLSARVGPIADVSTSSPLAYRLYEEGLRAFYQYDEAAAYRLMVAATQEDSTFAMAAYYAWRSGESVDPASEPALRERVSKLAPRAAERERLLILGMTSIQDEDPAALAPAESLAIRFPTDPNGQMLYGLVQENRGDFPAAISAFRRAMTLDSVAGSKPGAVCHACESLHRMYQVYLTWDSLPAAERALVSWERLRPLAPEPLGLLAEIRLRQERWAEADAALQQADSLTTRSQDYELPNLVTAIRRGRYDEVNRAAILFHDPDRNRRSDARWVWLIALRNQGRLKEALALLREGRVPGDGLVPVSTFEPDLVNQCILDFETGEYAAATRCFRKQAENATAIPTPGHRARGIAWNLTLAGTAFAAAGDTAMVRRLADSVEMVGPQSLFGRGARLHHFLRGLLLSQAGRQAEAVEAYRRAEFSPTEGYTRINYELAKSLMALHRDAEALPPLRSALRGGLDGSNLYLTRTEIHELLAQVFAHLGNRDSAATHYRWVAHAWESGDPPFQARRRLALTWLATNNR